MNVIDDRVRVGDLVQVKKSGLMSANAFSVPIGAPPNTYAQIWDGRVGKVIAMKDDDLTNTAIVIKIDEHEVLLWLWQVEKLANISPE